MSRSAKIFFASSVFLSGATIWGVHFIQKRESEVRRFMYRYIQ